MSDPEPDQAESNQSNIEEFRSISHLLSNYYEYVNKNKGSEVYYGKTVTFFRNQWQSWLLNNNLSTIDEINRAVMIEYISHLKGRDIEESTVHNYFHRVSTFLQWCRDEGYILTNPATYPTVQEHLPEEAEEVERQFWSEEKRQRLLDVVTEKVALAADPNERLIANRNRTLVFPFAYLGISPAEVLNTEDDRRNGLRWESVNLRRNKIEILGRGGELEEVYVPSDAKEPFNTLYKVLDPPSNSWPVFFSDHRPTHYNILQEELQEQGYTTDAIKSLLEENTTWDLFYEHDISPPALTDAGARNLLKSICEDENIEIDGDYLQPFGARRHLGKQYFDVSISAAEQGLRNQSIERVHDRYSE